VARHARRWLRCVAAGCTDSDLAAFSMEHRRAFCGIIRTRLLLVPPEKEGELLFLDARARHRIRAAFWDECAVQWGAVGAARVFKGGI
jgi:hypothetical protein